MAMLLVQPAELLLIDGAGGPQAGRGRQYQCAAANLPPNTCTNTKRRSESLIGRALVPTIAQTLREHASRVKATTAVRQQGQEAEGKLRLLDQARERSRLTYVDGHCTSEQMLEGFARIERARGELLALVKPVETITPEQLREAARDIERRWATWSPVSKRELLQSMITHITLNPDDLAASVITCRNE